MPKIGDFFPEGERRESAARQLTAGRVLYLMCDFTHPPKNKFVVVAAPDDPPLLLVLNSKIHPYIIARPDLRDCQATLTAKEHDFLSRDSFLDCSRTYESMSRETILWQLVGDVSRVKGELSATARIEVVEMIRRAKTISAVHRSRILAVLV